MLSAILRRHTLESLIAGSAAIVAFLEMTLPVEAVPSFARQTGQPCATCHVGAFGPQLTQYGREFKLNGYVWNDGKNHVPLAAMLQASLTHTSADQPGGAAPGFAPNNNPAIDQGSLFIGGQIFDSVGTFTQITYDGIAKQLHWDNLDVRYAQSGQLFDKPVILGITVNNNPTVQDVWNSTPGWGFPFAASSLAPTPAAGTLVDGGLAQTVIGAGGYALWNDLLYVEADLYKGLGRDVRNALGVVPVSGTNSYESVIPYWRVALQHDFGDHYLELGTFGLFSNVFPGGADNLGHSDHLTDVASSDKHTVKPWFAGRTDLSPPGVDLAAQGFPLIGGRLDLIEGNPIPALVYRAGKHIINVFVLPAGLSEHAEELTRRGYNLRHWSQGDLGYWAVSDASADEFAKFERAFRAASGS